MICPHCGSRSIIGDGELATCAGCGRFAHDRRDEVEQAFDRMRSELSPAERKIEAAIREGKHMPLPFQPEE